MAEEENGGVSRGTGKKTLKEIFTYDRLFLIMSIVFGAMFLGVSVAGALQLMGLHHYYSSDAQALLVITQNTRCFFIIFVPIILEKCFGFRLDLKIIFAFFVFGLFSTVLGEGFQFYYLDKTHTYDKTLHLISGMMQVYVAFGFGQYIADGGGSKHKFASALLFAFVASMAVAALWEILEFSSDVFTGSDMQKTVAPGILSNGGNTHAPLNGTNEEIGAFYRNPDGYRWGINDSMLDMVYCLGGSVFFIIVMVIVHAFKKNAFDNSLVYSPDFRFAFIKNRAAAKKAAEAAAVSDDNTAATPTDNGDVKDKEDK